MILTKPRLISQERLDLEDILVLFAGIAADSKYQTKQMWATTQFVMKGFVVSGLGGPSPATVSMADATLVNANNSGEFSWFVGESGAAAASVALTANTRNFLELALTTANGTPLTRAFWDPSAAGGEGAEFNQTTDTVTNIRCTVVALTGGFSGSADRIPLAIVDTDSGNNIKLIRDKRPLFYRLASTSDPLSGFAWASQTEPATTLNLSGVVGTFVASETITFSGGATAKVQTGGTTPIGVILLSNDTPAAGQTITGGTSGATATVSTLTDTFTGADKSIGTIRDSIAAMMTEIKRLKGTSFWFETQFGSINGIFNFINSIVVPNTSGAKVSWNGSVLSLTDASGAPANADVVAKIRKFGESSQLNLTREDGTGGSSTIAIADGQVLYVELPATGDRTYDGSGAGSTNYKVAARASFVLNDTNYWLAYREGTKLFFRGVGELQSGEAAEIGDNIPTTLLTNLGLADEVTAPAYSSDIRGTAAESLVARIGKLTDSMGDQQEDRSSYFRADDPVTWTGTQLTFTSNIVLETLNTKSGSVVTHVILAAGSPIALANGESAYVVINRAPGGNTENVTVVKSGTTPIPAQSQANKEVIILARRVDVSGVGYLHLPFHKQVLEQGQSVRLGASGSGSGGAGGINFLTLDSSFLTRNATNSDFETSTGNWLAYADAAAASPVDMTGGSPTTTVTRSTSSPLDGVGHGLLTKDAANRQGEGIACVGYVPIAHRTSRIYYEFAYKVISGTYALDDVKPFVYDVTNSQLITPFQQSKIFGTQGIAYGYFDIMNTTAQIRFGMHVASTSAVAYSIAFDDVKVTPVARSFSVPVSDWTNDRVFTYQGITVSASDLWTRRVGGTLEVEGRITVSGSSASALALIMPSNLAIDTTKLTSAWRMVGRATRNDAAGQFTSTDAQAFDIIISNASSSFIYMTDLAGASNDYATVNGSAVAVSPQKFHVKFSVPISGWSSNVQMADSATWLASSYLANGTRVTSTPTKLGEYRTFIKIINDSSGTDNAPGTAPSASDGMRIYAAAFNVAGTSGQTGRWEIFVGKGRDPGTVKLRAYASTGRAGFIDVTPNDYSTTSAAGLMFAYDPTTGVAVVDAMWANNGSNTLHSVGTAITAGGGNTPIQSNCYFDLVISENAISVGAESVRSQLRVSTGNGHGSGNTKIRRFSNVVQSTGTAITHNIGSDSVTGTEFTIREDGMYGMSYWDTYTGGAAEYGISVNSTQLTTNPDSITAADLLACMITANATQWAFLSVPPVFLRAGDVVRVHTGGLPNDTGVNTSRFTITKVNL